MSSSTETSTDVTIRKILRLKAIGDEAKSEDVKSGESEPNGLRVPYFRDPRNLDRRSLIKELKQRHLNHVGSTSVLIARLLKALVDEGLQTKFDPNEMDDRQPEKWLLLSNIAFDEACELEEDSDLREECMKLVNNWIENTVKSRDMLRQVAQQEITPTGQSDLFMVLLRFATALMLCPDVEQEAVASSGVSSNDVRGSMFMFSLMTGHCAIPDHLTESVSEAEEKRRSENSKSGKKRKVVDVEDSDGNPHKVTIGADVCIDLGRGRYERAKVSRVESTENSTTVFARPENIQFAGRHFEFELSPVEYVEAVADADRDVLKSVDHCDIDD